VLLTFFATPHIQQDTSIPAAFWFGTLTCLISLVVTLFATASDKLRDQQIKSEDIKASTPFKIRDVLKFPASVWLVYGVCMTFYIGVFVFVSVSASPFFVAKYYMQKDDASTVKGIPYSMSAVLAALMGFTVDRLGRKPFWQFVSSMLMVLAYFILTLSPVSSTVVLFGSTYPVGAILGVVVMGISYSLLAASLWPCIAILVDENIAGTAYSIMNATQNAALAVASVIAPSIIDSCQASASVCTTRPLYFLGSSVIVAGVLSFILTIHDLRNGGVLAKKSYQVQHMEESQPLIQ